MRKLNSNEQANVGTIILAVATAITIAISILLVYSVLGGFAGSLRTIDQAVILNMNGVNTSVISSHPAANATTALMSGLGTFFTISPIYIVVLIAVAIIGAVMGIMVFKRE
jgi:hypothetical protein